MGAGYEWNYPMTDDESFGFTLALRDQQGNPLVWSDYTFEYSLKGCGQDLLLTVGNGLSINVGAAAVVCNPDPALRLRPGQHKHGFRFTKIASGVTVQQFVGTITVTEGNF